jgi:hypothetical protein
LIEQRNSRLPVQDKKKSAGIKDVGNDLDWRATLSEYIKHLDRSRFSLEPKLEMAFDKACLMLAKNVTKPAFHRS